METYNGDLCISQDGPSNLGALTCLINYVSKSIDFEKASLSEEEKSKLRQSVGIALGKMQQRRYTPRMEMKNVSVEELIGMGGYGAIWKASLSYKNQWGEQQKEKVALKQLQARITETPDIWKERDVMILLKHERICNIIGAFYSTDVFLVLQLCYGSVSSLRYKIKHDNAVRFTVHLLEAIDWMHSNGIVHSDIKSDNCLIDRNNNLVLSDFGSSIILNEGQEVVHVTKSHGSAGYLDLEANQNGLFSRKTDIFSAACVIYEMDQKTGFLLYQLPDHPRPLYVDALINGRIVGLQPNVAPTPEMDRESLNDRAMNSRFGYLIQRMISATHPLTAEQALLDESLRLLKNSSGALFTESQPRSKYVTKEVDLDTSRCFEFMGDPDSSNINPGLLTFYYDELDTTVASPIQRRKDLGKDDGDSSAQEFENFSDDSDVEMNNVDSD